MKNLKSINVITNPPYSGSYHLTFFNVGLNLIGGNGRMCIIEPATWLINVRRNGKAKLYDEIKEKIKGHVESVVIENLNNDFDTGLHMPFSTTTIDMSKTFDTIDFNCCGEHKMVKSIYDCNLIGDYDLIWSILNKSKSFQHGNVMKNHVTITDMGDNMHYAKYTRVVTGNFCSGGNGRFNSDAMYRKHNGKDYYVGYFCSLLHCDGEIQDKLCQRRTKAGKIIEDSVAENIYGTKEELENWKHFVFNNKLPLFLNIVLTYSCDNNLLPFTPWLVDRKYTDDEINQLFNFTEEEIKLIDSTLKKFERNSPWFRRYMCGKESASDEEVNDFLNEGSNRTV